MVPLCCCFFLASFRVEGGGTAGLLMVLFLLQWGGGGQRLFELDLSAPTSAHINININSEKVLIQVRPFLSQKI